MVYIGIFFDPMERQRLLRRYGQKHPELHAHHMTIWHFFEGEGSRPLDAALPWGKDAPLKVIGYVEDDKAQVVILDPPSRLRPTSGRTPHVTLSTAPGVKPAYSNDLIQRLWDKGSETGAPTIRGKVGWFDGQRPLFRSPD